MTSEPHAAPRTEHTVVGEARLDAPRPSPGEAEAKPDTVRGICHATFAYDLGFSIDLDRVQRLLGESDRPRVVRARRPSPSWFEYEPAPVRVGLAGGEPIEVDGRRTEPVVDCLVFDFGALSLTYRIPLDGPVEALPSLSAALYDNERLLADSRLRAERVLSAIRDAVSRPDLSDLAEDYFVFALEPSSITEPPADFLDRHREAVAGVLLSESGGVSSQQVRHALANRMAYSENDLTVIDWNAAVLFDDTPEDVVALLSYANVELLEMRVLDRELDGLLDRAHFLLARLSKQRLWPIAQGGREVRSFAEIQTDSALMFEGVNNAIKLVGDQYLARLYETAAGKLHLPQWDASVLRKLQTAESVYQKMTDTTSHKRMEVLEIIIIVLIFVSIVMPFIPGLSGK